MVRRSPRSEIVEVSPERKIIARYGPEYGPEAIRRLEHGLAIIYEQDGILIEERPDRKRFAIRSEIDGSATILYELE